MMFGDAGCNAICVRTPAPEGSGLPVSDLDIHRTAQLFIQRQGDAAAERARMIEERMRRKGDNDGADTWLRITLLWSGALVC